MEVRNICIRIARRSEKIASGLYEGLKKHQDLMKVREIASIVYEGLKNVRQDFVKVIKFCTRKCQTKVPHARSLPMPAYACLQCHMHAMNTNKYIPCVKDTYSENA